MSADHSTISLPIIEFPAECWRDIPGAKGYQVSCGGNVRTRMAPGGNGGGRRMALSWKVLKPQPAKDRQLHVRVGGRRHVYVHRLVLLAFVGEPPPGHVTRHVNGDTFDNRLDNLMWHKRRPFVRTRAYDSWTNMKSRCHWERDKCYHLYGGRGIRVCERWMTFANFLADMGEPPPGMTLDRIDNDGNYEPGNCRWADAKTQNRNRRNSRLLTFRGESKPMVEWAEEFGLVLATLEGRLRLGWDIERALLAPIDTRCRKKQSCSTMAP